MGCPVHSTANEKEWNGGPKIDDEYRESERAEYGVGGINERGCVRDQKRKEETV